jgi:hypothetical protein
MFYTKINLKYIALNNNRNEIYTALSAKVRSALEPIEVGALAFGIGFFAFQNPSICLFHGSDFIS